MSGYLLSRISDVCPTDKRLTRPTPASHGTTPSCHVSRVTRSSDHNSITSLGSHQGRSWDTGEHTIIQAGANDISRNSAKFCWHLHKTFVHNNTNPGDMFRRRDGPSRNWLLQCGCGWQPRQTWYSPFTASQPRGAEQESEWGGVTIISHRLFHRRSLQLSSHTDSSIGGPYNHHLTQTLPSAVLTMTTRWWRGSLTRSGY